MSDHPEMNQADIDAVSWRIGIVGAIPYLLGPAVRYVYEEEFRAKGHPIRRASFDYQFGPVFGPPRPEDDERLLGEFSRRWPDWNKKGGGK